MNEPDFDFNTSCTTLSTCLFNIKNWILTTPGTVPLTIFLEPSQFTYTGNGSNTTFADALSRSTQTGGPSRYTPSDPSNAALLFLAHSSLASTGPPGMAGFMQSKQCRSVFAEPVQFAAQFYRSHLDSWGWVQSSVWIFLIWGPQSFGDMQSGRAWINSCDAVWHSLWELKPTYHLTSHGEIWKMSSSTCLTETLTSQLSHPTTWWRMMTTWPKLCSSPTTRKQLGTPNPYAMISHEYTSSKGFYQVLMPTFNYLLSFGCRMHCGHWCTALRLLVWSCSQSTIHRSWDW